MSVDAYGLIVLAAATGFAGGVIFSALILRSAFRRAVDARARFLVSLATDPPRFKSSKKGDPAP